jgi:hypothetical protein
VLGDLSSRQRRVEVNKEGLRSVGLRIEKDFGDYNKATADAVAFT